MTRIFVIQPGKLLLYRGRPFDDLGCRRMTRPKLCAHLERVRIEIMRIAAVGIDRLPATIDDISIYRRVTQDDRAALLADVPLEGLLLIRV
jgi:hypothetical protein